ncbi:MAG: hypothetical protein Q7T93_16650 [Methylobacterium sp.]|uniref:hypothetical protein n=1 Tax=Methylobacterium sp. TaxID=409 RepID=UPI002720CA19|nr:hypothetical protein [Methylobacterium sp.]MDO9428448.1 hypothetical protein [Methylobacterium sp.]
MQRHNATDFSSSLTRFLGATALASGIFQGFASGAIGSGELVTLNEGGYIRRVSERLPLSAHMLANQGLNPVAGPLQATPDNPASVNLHPHKLPSGTMVYVSGRYLYFVNPMAQLMYRLDNVQPVTAWTVLSTGQVVTTWITGTGPYTVNAKVWNEDGSSPTGVFTVGTTTLLGGNTLNTTGNTFVVAAGPNFHVTWEQHLTTGGPTMTNYLQTVRNDGTLQGPPAQVVTGSYPIVPVACENGSVLVGTVANDFTPYVSRYAAGVQAWGPTLVTAFSGAPVSYIAAGAQMVRGFQGFVELANGNFALVCRDASVTTSGHVIVCGPGGQILASYVQVGCSLTFAVGTTNSYSVVPSALGFGTFFANGSGSSWNVWSTVFDNAGNVITATANYATTAFASAPKIVCRSTGNGFVFVGYNGAATALGVTDTYGTIQGTLIVPAAVANHYVCSTGDGLVSHLWSTGANGLNSTTYKINRCSIVGVADAAAANGEAVTIKGAGNFKMPSTQPFYGTLAFDGRAAVIPGCKGTVSNDFATLFGYV